MVGYRVEEMRPDFLAIKRRKMDKKGNGLEKGAIVRLSGWCFGVHWSGNALLGHDQSTINALDFHLDKADGDVPVTGFLKQMKSLREPRTARVSGKDDLLFFGHAP